MKQEKIGLGKHEFYSFLAIVVKLAFLAGFFGGFLSGGAITWGYVGSGCAGFPTFVLALIYYFLFRPSISHEIHIDGGGKPTQVPYSATDYTPLYKEAA